MAVFFKNTCQYNDCHRKFLYLQDLIVHIENDHLDFDPKTMEILEETKPDYLPMSYVLKFGHAQTVIHPVDVTETSSDNKQLIELTSFALDSSEKPYVCKVEGCGRRYKNVNGIKYHYRNHHKMFPPNYQSKASKRKSKAPDNFGYNYSAITSSDQVPLASFNYQKLGDVEASSVSYNSDYCDLYQNFED